MAESRRAVSHKAVKVNGTPLSADQLLEDATSVFKVGDTLTIGKRVTTTITKEHLGE